MIKNILTTPAHSLLALILSGGGKASVNAETGRLEIAPAKLANKLREQIVAHKADLIRLILAISCPLCGFRLRMQGKARLCEEKTNDGLVMRKFVTKSICENCGKRGPDYIQPDFPVFDKSGKEI